MILGITIAIYGTGAAIIIIVLLITSESITATSTGFLDSFLVLSFICFHIFRIGFFSPPTASRRKHQVRAERRENQLIIAAYLAHLFPGQFRIDR